jgi:very-short-patch-repair endonuclease
LAVSNRRTGIEIAVAKMLDLLGVEYLEQEMVPGTTFTADFLIPSKRIVIECDGTYWHARPGAKEHDAKRDETMRLLGYAVVRLPEADIKTGACGDVLMKAVNL